MECLGEERRLELEFAIEAAGDETQQNGMRFLIENMRQGDLRSLPIDLLLQNVSLAFKARQEYEWCARLPISMFHNYVLPFAVFDEERDDWREELMRVTERIVAGIVDVSEAVALINTHLWDLIGVHYHATKRRVPNQNMTESRHLGKSNHQMMGGHASTHDQLPPRVCLLYWPHDFACKFLPLRWDRSSCCGHSSLDEGQWQPYVV